MKHYRREKLHADPKNVLRWRTISVGAHRIKIAVLRGGKAVATSVAHPIRERRNPGCALGKTKKRRR